MVALGIMIMISFIGIAAITTTSIDMDISGSDKRSTQSLYLAEAGLQRAVYEYLWPSFNDESISPMTDVFGWANASVGDTVYEEVSVSGQGSYTVVISAVSDPGPVAPFVECRDITLQSRGLSLGGSENTTVEGVVRLGTYPSSVFDYAYFMNNFGWWAGFPNGGCIMNGNTRSNGHYDLISGRLDVNGNPRYSPIDGEVLDNGGVYAGGIVLPLDGDGYGGMAQYLENRHSYGGVDNSFLDPAYVEMPNLHDPGDLDNDGIIQELNPYYLMLARGELGLEGGRVGQDTNGDGVLQDSEVVIQGCYGDEAGETGNVVLTGKKDYPIIIEGPVAVTGDFVIKGWISGQGAFYVGRNTYIAAEVRYKNRPSARPTFDYGHETPEEYKERVNSWVEANEGADLVGFMTRESIFFGNHPDGWWQNGVVGRGGWLEDYRNDGREDLGTDRLFGTMDNEIDPYAHSEKEWDGYWTVDVYDESSGERRTVDLPITGATADVPAGFRVVPGSGEDIDGDGEYDDAYNYVDDLDFRVPFNSTNFHNLPEDVSDFEDLAELSVEGIDGVLYTNHAVAGWLTEDCTVNGTLVARNEAVLVAGGHIYLNHDERLTGTGGTCAPFSIYLPRVKGMASLSWEEK